MKNTADLYGLSVKVMNYVVDGIAPYSAYFSSDNIVSLRNKPKLFSF